ncbi:MAG: hypothetical protein M0R03_22135 [Novosphingobium sp.]|nr:hypothetical protein [Novosphingobium sp.]
MGRKQWLGSAVLLLILTVAALLSGCAPATVAGGEGCRAYQEARAALPPDQALLATPREVLVWINETDARMTAVCT